jgi:hypothetical protein
LDLPKNAGPRGAHFEEYKPGMFRLAEDLTSGCSRRRLVEVDYGDPAIARVADEFFGGVKPPPKDCFGAPFYGYFLWAGHRRDSVRIASRL